MSEEKTVEKIQKLVEGRRSDKVEKFLKDKNLEVVKAAIMAFGDIKDEVSNNHLSKLLDDPNPEIRKTAIVAFAKGGSEYAKTFIQHRLTKETDPDVKEVCSKTLREYKVIR